MNNLFEKIKPYLISVAISLGTGILSALVTMGNMDIYQTINKPPLAPPAVLFPIVWTVLYVLMGISSARVYLARDINPSAAKDTLALYGTSLIVNFAWSIIFFNFTAYIVSFVWLLFLLALIIATIVRYYSFDKPAAYLQIPYAVWVAFAGYLNLAIFILNS